MSCGWSFLAKEESGRGSQVRMDRCKESARRRATKWEWRVNVVPALELFDALWADGLNLAAGWRRRLGG